MAQPQPHTITTTIAITITITTTISTITAQVAIGLWSSHGFQSTTSLFPPLMLTRPASLTDGIPCYSTPSS